MGKVADIEYIEAYKENEKHKDDIDDIDGRREGKKDVSDQEFLIQMDNEEYIEAYKDDENSIDFPTPSGSPSRMGLLDQSKTKIKLQDELVQFTNVTLQDDCGDVNHGDNEQVSTKFFTREWEAFKNEKGTKLSDKNKVNTYPNFDELIKEWKSEGNENHWSNRKVKKKEKLALFCSPQSSLESSSL
eukprot:TRINITY_DN22104_c0_g1_i1.p1 TRINITY_DN22104_c0_g1~~TRINITY_DN22104_c0_g1_i1.p1  ORF type:complete len:195 (-),score=60.45 TRINITY_DN22104_c0_g1_i1:706-1266(-)